MRRPAASRGAHGYRPGAPGRYPRGVREATRGPPPSRPRSGRPGRTRPVPTDGPRPREESLVRTPVTLGLAAAAAAVLAGCSNVPDGAVAAEAYECPVGTEGCEEVRPIGEGGEMFVLGDEFLFDVEDGIAVTGEITMTLDNVGDAFHNIEVLGAADGSEIIEADAGEQGDGTVLLFPGEWTIICNVPGHRSAGMEAVVTVFATPEEAEAAGLEDELDAADGAGGGGATGEETTIDVN
ncbi:hypothetical protein FTX61_11220 [Nitriliruptoraceae bacterium ZYF776]|nr:hypothetical protein [Profundirhabdus halotolerans]